MRKNPMPERKEFPPNQPIGLSTVPDVTMIASDGPAVYVNRIVVNGGGMIKISFIEQYSQEQEPHFRSAVILPLLVADQLAKILMQTLAQEVENAEVQAKAQKSYHGEGTA